MPNFTDDLELDSINPKRPTPAHNHRPPPGKGRIRGRPNFFTRDIRAAITEAANIVGSDGNGKDGLTGYMVDLAKFHKKAFANLLGKALPVNVGLDNPGAGVVVAVNIVGIPQGCNSDGSVMESVRSSFQQIEHQPQREPVLDARARRLAELKAMPLEQLAELAGIDIADVVED